MGILSMDDDVLRPCEAIDSGFFKWTENPSRMVGFDARSYEVKEEGHWSYAYMSVTEKANRYSLTLPRYCFIHRDYLNWYFTDMPKPILEKVESIFNCEDIAMSFFVSSLTGGQPPLLADFWAIKSMLKLYSPKRISGQKQHKSLRDDCVDSFADLLNLKDKLQPATYVHRDNYLFECGAEANKSNQEDNGMVGRHTEHVEQVGRWSNMNPQDAMKEVSKLINTMAGNAYVRGLIEKTEPWQKRWKR
eukprot:CAMPEP_0116833666 /NCGR_PEP_ID=MMETSP0418-20121206/6563_1 /TAXON_ID=1158023 /ORGANISM="Astrosyne radiata, Strain 13vi08-1A" /LENGTH=246 /DNA_ID=CAMNT_0004463141 /DNA_START=31 /DNA_END=771 /DNA_ORIENTATION=+